MELLVRDADFADEFDREMRGAGVLKLGGIDGGVRLGGGRKRGAGRVCGTAATTRPCLG